MSQFVPDRFDLGAAYVPPLSLSTSASLRACHARVPDPSMAGPRNVIQVSL